MVLWLATVDEFSRLPFVSSVRACTRMGLVYAVLVLRMLLVDVDRSRGFQLAIWVLLSGLF